MVLAGLVTCFAGTACLGADPLSVVINARTYTGRPSPLGILHPELKGTCRSNERIT